MLRPTIIFLHVPKTAGTTFRDMARLKIALSPPTNLLRKKLTFGLSGIQPFSRRCKAIASLPQNKQKRIKLIYGHFGVGVHKYLDQPTTYITVLRDPIARTISAFSYLRSDFMTQKQKFPCPDDDLAAFAQSTGEYAPFYINNLQVRMLGSNDASIDPAPGEPCSKHMLEMAKDNIDKHFPVVGLTERFDESLLLIKRQLGWRTCFYSTMNIAVKKQHNTEYAQSDLDAVRDANQMDLKLYEFAQKRLQEQVDVLGPEFANELITFRKRNLIYDRTCGKVFRSIRNAKRLFKGETPTA